MKCNPEKLIYIMDFSFLTNALKQAIPIWSFVILPITALSQIYIVPNAQIQPKWVFPLWFENGDGQKDTLYFCYDPASASNGYSNDSDTLMGEILIPVNPAKFQVSFEAVGANESLMNKVDVNYDLNFAAITILFQNITLPFTLSWDPILFYSDSIPFPDQDPSPRAQGKLWFDLPMQVDECSFSVPILMTDTTLNPSAYCQKTDSVVFFGSAASYLIFSVHPWTGIWLGIDSLRPAGNFSLFPNPANNLIILTTSTLTDLFTHFEILSTTGILIMDRIITNQKSIIDISEIPSGAYFIVVKRATDVVYSKLFFKT